MKWSFLFLSTYFIGDSVLGMKIYWSQNSSLWQILMLSKIMKSCYIFFLIFLIFYFLFLFFFKFSWGISAWLQLYLLWEPIWCCCIFIKQKRDMCYFQFAEKYMYFCTVPNDLVKTLACMKRYHYIEPRLKVQLNLNT